MRLQAIACSILLLAGSAGAKAASDPQAFDQIERGRYLATVGDCAACHTASGGMAFAGGKPLETPFGTLLAPNVTPDRDTGIGAWSDDDFVNALRAGIGRNGVHLYPAMPYTYYTKMTRDDVLAIRAFLNTLPPAQNPVQSNQLPFPFNVRASLAGWNLLFFKPGEFVPVAGKSEAWNRGAYLVEGPAHCGLCHTPKNLLGGDQTSRAYQGYVLQGWVAPNLTTDRRIGLGSWSEDDMVEYLKTGRNGGQAASGPMAEVIRDSTSHMTDADLKAIAAYFKDQPTPTASEVQPVSDQDPAMRSGEAIYVDNCAACHAKTGAGIARLFPALKASASVQSLQPVSVIRVILQGARAVATTPAPTSPAMPAYGWKLSDAQIAAVATYIRNAWGNAAAAVSASEVASRRKSLSAGTE